MALAGKEILIVDDDEEFRMLAKRIIINAGCTVSEASTIDSALMQIREHEPHLVILDILFEDKNKSGLDFLKMRSNDLMLSRIPIMVFSAIAKPSAVKQAMATGACDYLVKPINSAKLVQKLRKYAKDKELKKKVFEEDKYPDVTVNFPGEMVKLSEVATIVRAPIKIAAKSKVVVKSELFNSWGHPDLSLVTARDSIFHEEGLYDTEIDLIGVVEAIIQKIRSMPAIR